MPLVPRQRERENYLPELSMHGIAMPQRAHWLAGGVPYVPKHSGLTLAVAMVSVKI